MTTHSHSGRPANNQQPQDLLQALLENPPAPHGVSLAPTALRSVEAQRDHALRGFLRRTWVDRLLHRAEPMLLLAALIVFAVWLADGPLRDWLYTREQQANAAAPIHAPTASPTAVAQAAALPFVTTAMSQTSALDGALAPRRALPPPRLAAPEPTRLTIPAIQVDTPVKEVFVVDGVWEVAEYAAGYLHGTALPGDGNTALAGHAGLRGAVFRDLGRLKPGDDVYLEAGGWHYHYRVRSQTNVWPTQVEVLDPTPVPVLTMLTCTNWDTQRLVVVADLIDAKPSPSV